jgi:general secretion pathway protein A
VVARYHLGALSAAETTLYVEHRLGVAGLQGPLPFDRAAMKALHTLTGGVPRRINLLADRALLGAYGQGLRQVARPLVERAANEVFDAGSRPQTAWYRAWPMGAGTALLALVGVALVGLWGWPGMLPEGAVAPLAAAAPSASSTSAAPMASSAAAADRAPAPSAPGATVAALAAPLADDPAALGALALADEAQAWRELALHWNVAIGEGDPCVAARQASLACFRSTSGGLGLLRTLSRPALLVLRHDDGRRSHALLVALDDDSATLQGGRERLRLALPALARVWRGEFATFWRTPPAWEPGAAGSSVARGWAAPRLASALPRLQAQDFGAQVAAFQLLHGLPVDGQAGPLTLMQLARVAGVDEPRLGAAASPGGR